MDPKDEKYLILEQYRIYSDAKEKFTDRQFFTNKFYLVLNLILFITTYLLGALTPQVGPVIVLSIIGFFVSIMWWMNIDSYQFLIKIKYANVLEEIEKHLPEQPYQKEFQAQQNLKKSKKGFILFGDWQKHLTLVVALVYIVICFRNVSDFIRYNLIG